MSTQNTTTAVTPAPENRPRVKLNPKAPRQDLPLLSPEERLRGPEEVALGFSLAQVQVEALRCLQCKNPTCVDACPLHINVKGFIGLMSVGDFAGAFDKISEESPFPGICGRVCQHELFCERACLFGKKLNRWPSARSSVSPRITIVERRRQRLRRQRTVARAWLSLEAVLPL